MSSQSRPIAVPCSRPLRNNLRDRESAAVASRSNPRPTIEARPDRQRLSAMPAWPKPIAFPASQLLAGSHCAGACKGNTPTSRSFATMSCRHTCRQKGFCRSLGATGASRTSSTGFSTSISPRTAIGPARTTRPRTWPSCESLHSTSCKRSPTRPRYGAKSSVQAGTTPSFCRQSAICDSPARKGEREHTSRVANSIPNSTRFSLSPYFAGSRIET